MHRAASALDTDNPCTSTYTYTATCQTFIQQPKLIQQLSNLPNVGCAAYLMLLDKLVACRGGAGASAALMVSVAWASTMGHAICEYGSGSLRSMMALGSCFPLQHMTTTASHIVLPVQHMSVCERIDNVEKKNYTNTPPPGIETPDQELSLRLL